MKILKEIFYRFRFGYGWMYSDGGSCSSSMAKSLRGTPGHTVLAVNGTLQFNQITEIRYKLKGKSLYMYEIDSNKIIMN